MNIFNGEFVELREVSQGDFEALSYTDTCTLAILTKLEL